MKSRLSFEDLEALQACLGHKFACPERLEQALTHASAVPDKQTGSAAERLEFLGDRVLGLVIAEALMQNFPDEPEGALARRLNALVDGRTCMRLARETGLDRFVITGGARRLSKRGRETVLADTMEAVIGALYLDGGLASVRAFILRYWQEWIVTYAEPPVPPKSALQEWAQAQGKSLPVYRLVSRKGPDHAPVFMVEVRVSGHEGLVARGRSRQEAESEAAASLLAWITLGEAH